MLNFMATQLHLYKKKLTEVLTKLTNGTQSLIYTTGKKLMERVNTELVDAYQFCGHFQSHHDVY